MAWTPIEEPFCEIQKATTQHNKTEQRVFVTEVQQKALGGVEGQQWHNKLRMEGGWCGAQHSAD